MFLIMSSRYVSDSQYHNKENVKLHADNKLLTFITYIHALRISLGITENWKNLVPLIKPYKCFPCI